MEFYYFTQSRLLPGPKWTLHQVFEYRIRFQILCQNQEEVDTITGFSLVYGREVDVCTWDQWRHRVRMSKIQEHYGTGKLLRLLPIVFTTYDPGDSLREI